MGCLKSSIQISQETEKPGFPLVKIQHYDLTWEAVILNQTTLNVLEENGFREPQTRYPQGFYGLSLKPNFCSVVLQDAAKL